MLQTKSIWCTLLFVCLAFILLCVYISSESLRRWDAKSYRQPRPFIFVTNHSAASYNVSKATPSSILVSSEHYCGVTYQTSFDLLNEIPIKPHPRVKNPCMKNAKGQGFLCAPYMFLIGAPKCGTTDLYLQLTKHPEFVKPATKEPHWLSKSRFYQRTSYRLYLQHYFRVASMKISIDYIRHQNLTSGNYTSLLITGDASATYLHDNDFWMILPGNEMRKEPVYTNPDYIHHLNPSARIIISVRNPIDRLWSDYLYSSMSKNKSAERFHDIVVQATAVYQMCFMTRSVPSCVYDKMVYINSTTLPAGGPAMRPKTKTCPQIFSTNVHLRLGLYSVYLKEYLRVFPREQIHVHRLEDYSRNVTKASNDVFRFLGMKEMLDPQTRNTNKTAIHNKRKPKDEMLGNIREDTRQLLYNFYKPFNEELSNLLKDPSYNYGLY